jgi:hypothetical protein
MVDDLLRHHELGSMTRAAVVALLGPPTQTTYFRDYDLVYWLGPERGFMSIDSEWLVMRVGANDRIADCRIVTD